MHLSIYQFINLCIYQFINLSIYKFYPFVEKNPSSICIINIKTKFKVINI